MACLDTSLLVDILRKKPEAASIMDELDKGIEALSIAAPSVMALWAGALRATDSEKEKGKVSELIKSLDVLPFDENSAKEAAEIEFALSANGISIDAEDLLIAAIARVNSEKIVTRDEHFTRIPGLIVLKY
jgi:tRNA(fMet)-specific endonuclease VapC